MQTYLDIEETQRKKRVADRNYDRKHGSPFKAKVRVEGTAGTKTVRVSNRNLHQFDEKTPLDLENTDNGSQLDKRMPLQKYYGDNKDIRKRTRNAYEMDPERHKVVKDAGQRYSRENKDLLGRN